MAVPKAASKAAAGKPAPDVVEQKVIALAEQLGWFMGTVQARADGWLDREKLRKEVGRIRDGAADLLTQLNRAGASAQKVVVEAARSARNGGAKPAVVEAPVVAAKAPRPSRGAVDAPGKRHRKPTPNVNINKMMGEPEGKHMGQKNFKKGHGRPRITG